MNIQEIVKEENIKFRQIIPKLIEDGLQNKWVVFKDGEVKDIFVDENNAVEFALEKYGVNAGYVIAPVVIDDPTPITAGVMFWLQ